MGENIEGGEISVCCTEKKNTKVREGFSQLKGGQEWQEKGFPREK